MSRHSTGFTLIEMLVVLLIISIVATVAMLALGNTINDQQIKNSGQRLSNMISAVEEQAILEPNIYGLLINAKGYGFEKFVPVNGKKQWVLITTDNLLSFRNWPTGTQINLTLSDNASASDNTPQIIISPSGDVTPFILQLGNSKPLMSIQVEASGKVVQKNL